MSTTARLSSLALTISLCTAAVAPAQGLLPTTTVPVAPVAWEIELPGEEAGAPAPWKRHEDWFLRALREGVVLRTEQIGHGVTNPFKAEIEYDEHRVYAVWKPIRNRNYEAYETYEAEVAAYRLSRRLGVDMVPPTVKRKIGRQWGSLQLWVDNHRMFSDVLDQRPAGFFGSDQFQIMRLFDALIDNPDRNAGNYLVGEDWSIVLIDHSRALNFEVRQRQREAPMPSRFQRALVHRLRALDRDQLGELLGDLYPKGAIKQIHTSAKRLLRYVEEEVELHGAAAVYFDLPRPAEGELRMAQSVLRHPIEN